MKSVITAPDIEKILGQPRYSNEIYKTANMAGVAVGLAWTYVGGDILFIEAIVGDGKGEGEGGEVGGEEGGGYE